MTPFGIYISGLFQFPTGWNSTPTTSGAEPLIGRFNSQRDGILPWEAKDISLNAPFQFPTGWNSTVDINELERVIKGFQFPTGWNSTFFYSTAGVKMRSVSIPNGMEFYYNGPTSFNVVKRCFNSQRDGILLYLL